MDKIIRHPVKMIPNLGGPAGSFNGFFCTGRDLERVQVEDELGEVKRVLRVLLRVVLLATTTVCSPLK